MFAKPKLTFFCLLLLAAGAHHVFSQGSYDLGIQVYLPAIPVISGQPFKFTVVVTNAGPGTADWVFVTVQRNDIYYIGEEMWYLSWPQEFEEYPESMEATLRYLGARTSLKLVFTAVALRPGEHHIVAIVGAGEETGPLSNSQDRLLSVAPGPGLIMLDQAAYVMPKGGTAAIGVRRIGGDNTTVAVSYATSNGTATANADYNPARGRLVFGPGETNKSITLSAIDDPAFTCNKSFSLHLFGSEGGVSFVRHSNALVTIAGSTPLAGYVRPISVSTHDTQVFIGGSVSTAALSSDGRKVAFLDQRLDNPFADVSEWQVVLRDLVMGRQESRSVIDFMGEKPLFPIIFDAPILTEDGRMTAFTGSAYDWEQDSEFKYIFARSYATESNTVIQGTTTDSSIQTVMFSANGRLLAYEEWLWDRYENQILAHDFLTASNECITLGIGGAKANGNSTLLAVNATGRYVVFQSWASNLVPNDTNGWSDVFLRDRQTGRTELISLNASGTGSRKLPSFGPARITPDARYVMFVGSARETVPPEPPGFLTHIFVRDRVAGVTRKASIEPSQSQGDYYNANFGEMSEDGRFVVYHSFDLRTENADDNKEVVNVYFADMQTGQTRLVSKNCRGTGGGNAPSYWPQISGNGAYVFFFSRADDLVPGAFLPVQTNVFRWERAAEKILLVTANMQGTGGVPGEHTLAGVSHDGRVLVFSSSATNLVAPDVNWLDDIFVWNANDRVWLYVTRIDDLLTVSWQADAPPSVLESQTSSGAWVPVQEPTSIVDDLRVCVLSISNATPTRFFRLRLL